MTEAERYLLVTYLKFKFIYLNYIMFFICCFFALGKGGKIIPSKGKGFGGKGAKPRGNELKSKDQILKARHRKEITMQRQNKGKLKGKGGRGKPSRRK